MSALCESFMTTYMTDVVIFKILLYLPIIFNILNNKSYSHNPNLDMKYFIKYDSYLSYLPPIYNHHFLINFVQLLNFRPKTSQNIHNLGILSYNLAR